MITHNLVNVAGDDDDLSEEHSESESDEEDAYNLASPELTGKKVLTHRWKQQV